MQRKPFTRRRFMATSAAVSASMIGAVRAQCARRWQLTIGMWTTGCPRQRHAKRHHQGMG
jgi:hypothetical protein